MQHQVLGILIQDPGGPFLQQNPVPPPCHAGQSRGTRHARARALHTRTRTRVQPPSHLAQEHLLVVLCQRLFFGPLQDRALGDDVLVVQSLEQLQSSGEWRQGPGARGDWSS